VASARALTVAAVAGLGVALYFALWFKWPTFLAIAAGATLAVVMLLFAASLGDDPQQADAAWRAAAPDLVERERASATEPDLSAEPGDRPTAAGRPAGDGS
jgi:hypothetical protein